MPTSVPVAILIDPSGGRQYTLLRVDGVSGDLGDLPTILLRPDGGIPGLPAPLNPIKAARLAAGISQRDLAGVMGISQPMLAKMERTGRAVLPSSINRARTAIQAYLEYRRLLASTPRPTQEDLEEAQRPLIELSQARKRRDPREREMLRRQGDPMVLLETESREKVAGARATRPRRSGRG